MGSRPDAVGDSAAAGGEMYHVMVLNGLTDRNGTAEATQQEICVSFAGARATFVPVVACF